MLMISSTIIAEKLEDSLGRYEQVADVQYALMESQLKHLRCCVDILDKRILDLMTPSRKSRDFSHGMDRPLLSPFMGLFVCFCIFLVIDIFLYNFFAHIAQRTHIVTWRPKMTAPILATSYFWMIL